MAKRFAVSPLSALRRTKGAIALFASAPWVLACSSNTSGGAIGVGGASAAGGSSNTSTGSATGGADSTRSSLTGGVESTGGTPVSTTGGTKSGTGGFVSGGSSSLTGNGGTNGFGGTKQTTGTAATGGTSASTLGGTHSTGGTKATGGVTGVGGNVSTGGSSVTIATTQSSGGAISSGGSSAIGTKNTGGSTSAGGCTSGPIGTFTGELANGIKFMDTDGKPVNAHGGGIIKEGDTYYLHGEYFLSTTTDNAFNGFSMYSSKDLSTWKNEGIILPQQASGELGPNRKGERPHIVKCPSTGEFVLYAHAASSDYQTDKEVVYATSSTVNGTYTYKGPLTNSSGTTASHSDMSAITDGSTAYVLTESGHVYTLAADCHSWLSDKAYSQVNGDSGGSESPTVFKAGSTYYWIGSYKTGWRANNNFYSTAPAITGPWTYQGYIAPVTDPSNNISDQRTWLSQSTWVQPVEGCKGTVYVYWGDHWYGTQDTTNPGKHNDQATYVFQPLVFNGTAISMPTYQANWTLDVGYGTWSP